jgi:hypothetical protein
MMNTANIWTCKWWILPPYSPLLAYGCYSGNYLCDDLRCLAFGVAMYALSYLSDCSPMVLMVFETLTLAACTANPNEHHNLATFYHVTQHAVVRF